MENKCDNNDRAPPSRQPYFDTAELGQCMTTMMSFRNELYVNQYVDNYLTDVCFQLNCLSLLPFMFEINVKCWLNICLRAWDMEGGPASFSTSEKE